MTSRAPTAPLRAELRVTAGSAAAGLVRVLHAYGEASGLRFGSAELTYLALMAGRLYGSARRRWMQDLPLRPETPRAARCHHSSMSRS